MRPKTFQNHFGGCGGVAFVFAVANPEAADVVHQALHFAELLNALVGGAEIRNFQFTAGLEPLVVGWKLASAKCLEKTRPVAVRMSSRAMTSAPLSSPSYSSSILPVMEGRAA